MVFAYGKGYCWLTSKCFFVDNFKFYLSRTFLNLKLSLLLAYCILGQKASTKKENTYLAFYGLHRFCTVYLDLFSIVCT